MSDPINRIPWGLMELVKHAPHSIPDWFSPEMPPKPEMPGNGRPKWDDDYTPEWKSFYENEALWIAESNRQKSLQWPLFWAQGVFEAATKLGLVEKDDPEFVAERKEQAVEKGLLLSKNIALTNELIRIVGALSLERRRDEETILGGKVSDLIEEIKCVIVKHGVIAGMDAAL